MIKRVEFQCPQLLDPFLTSQGYNGFISYPSFSSQALECCTQDRIEKLSNSIDTLNPFEEKEIIFATSVLSESSNLIFDTEGRVQFTKTFRLRKSYKKYFICRFGNNFSSVESLETLKNLDHLLEKSFAK